MLEWDKEEVRGKEWRYHTIRQFKKCGCKWSTTIFRGACRVEEGYFQKKEVETFEY